MSNCAGLDAERGAVVRVRRGVVDEDVETAETLDRGGDAGVRRVDVAGVRGEHRGVAADLGGRSLELVDLARRQHHAGAGVGQPCAIALPIPFDAPVTSATLPSSEICMLGNVLRDLTRASVGGVDVGVRRPRRSAARVGSTHAHEPDPAALDLFGGEVPTLELELLAGARARVRAC